MLISNHVQAGEDKAYIACIECDANKAVNLAKNEGAQLAGGIFVRRDYVLFDPVTEFIKTIRYEKSYEAELGRYYEVTYEISTHDDDVQALALYNSILDSMYLAFGGPNAPSVVYITSDNSSSSYGEGVFSLQSQSVEKFNTLSSSSMSSSVTDKEWIYNVVKGTTLVPLPFESYAWMTRSQQNPVEMSVKLAELMQLTNPANTISLAVKLRFKKFLAQLPLQFTVAFENGDTVTFFLDCVICSVNYLPLHETAYDKNGNKLSNVVKSGSGSAGDSGYGDFYATAESLGAVVSRHCSTVYTGPRGNTSPQTVCFYIYN